MTGIFALAFLAAAAHANIDRGLFQGGFGEFNPRNLPVPDVGEGRDLGGPAAASVGGFQDIAARVEREHPEIPKVALLKLFAYLKNHPVENRRHAGLIDMDRPSDEKRFFIIDLRTGSVESFLVAHGAGSGRGADAERFSDRPRSHMSSLGVYTTGSEYEGKHGRSLTLIGREESNDQADERAVVIHGAAYVSDEYAREHGRVGNSWGCPAVDYRYRDHIIDELGGGAALLIYSAGVEA